MCALINIHILYVMSAHICDMICKMIVETLWFYAHVPPNGYQLGILPVSLPLTIVLNEPLRDSQHSPRQMGRMI